MAIRLLLNSATHKKCIITYDESRVYHIAQWETGGQEASHVLPGILAGCDAAGIAPEEITSISIVHGPGSFTGLRVAVTVVNMMKVSMPHLQLFTLSAGQLLAHADDYRSSQYLFAPYPSDIFFFTREGKFEQRTTSQDVQHHMEIATDAAGEIAKQLRGRFAVRDIDLSSVYELKSLLLLEERLTPTEGQILPFYAKDANITTPKNPPIPLQQ